MRIHRALTLATALTLALGLAGCVSEHLTPLGPETVGLDQRLEPQALKALPLSGRCETTFNPPSFPPPLVHQQVDTGDCRLAHLGRAGFYSVKEIDFVAGTQTTTEARFTAANGDVLLAVGTGTSAPSQPGRVRFVATLTFIGGTGRFAQASGEAYVEGEAALSTATAHFEIVHGWIAYDASARRDT